jgi:uncharacterized protein YyaL (SSP411 family)
MPNRLADELSPYLLQHANNPVDWFPWGPEAIEKARAEDKPIFLSVGYAACHWCHVMEHESFEDESIAAVLNEHFVSIKVDREERPDLDNIYMNAVQLMTGRGGWPMSVFMTPDLHPFFSGTYWPPEPRMQMPGFRQVLDAVQNAWLNRREDALKQAAEITRLIQQIDDKSAGSAALSQDWLAAAEADLRRDYDFTNGGFGAAPKFPHPMHLALLLRRWRREPSDNTLRMVTLNLDKMAAGGIYDHLAGGFARYSVDERWLVPHFEKMLYDNALLSGAYLDGYQATGNREYARVTGETLDYVLEYLTDEQGGFHSTEDADSEGEEGKFYVWTVDEIQEILGSERAERFCYVYDVTAGGNFEGKNILNLPKTFEQCATVKGWDLDELTTELAESRTALLQVRDQRVRPGKDDKVLTNWNGLMIDSMARAGAVLGEPRYLAAAHRAAEFLRTNMTREDGRLWHTWRRGRAKLDAYLDDYACLANGLISLYEAGFQEQWIDEAVRLTDLMLVHFRDTVGGGFFYTADDHEQLIVRQRDVHDSSVPSGSGMAATVLLRLGRLCGRADFLTAATETLSAMAGVMQGATLAAGQGLIALDMHFGPAPEIVVLGESDQPEVAEVLLDLRRRYLPNTALACRPKADAEDGSLELGPIFQGKVGGGTPPTVFICEKFACQEPVHGPDAAMKAWAELEMQAQTG